MIKNKFIRLVLILIAIPIIVLIVDQFRTPMYISEAKFLVVIDPSGQRSSANYDSTDLANHQAVLISEFIDTRSFTREVLEGVGLVFKSEDIDSYMDNIQAKVVGDTEVVELKVIDESPQKANKIAQTAIDNLIKSIQNEGWLFEGTTIKVVDQPGLSDKPTSPNYFFDLLIGYIIALIGTLIYMLFDRGDD